MSASFKDLYRSLEFDRALDVDDPADRALYVEDMHKSEDVSPVDNLRTAIEMSDQPSTWLFTGHRGVGKSTELRRMAAELRKQGHLVIVADMGEYLNLVEPVKTETLLLTLVAALADGADHSLGGERLTEGYAQRLWNFLTNTEVAITQGNAQLKLGETQLSFKAELRDNPSFREKVLKSIAGATAVLARQVREFAKTVVEDMRKQRGADKQVILILDSLERLRVTGADAQLCYDAICSTFDQNAEHLKLEHLHVVYSVPPYLPFLIPRIGSYFGVNVCTLPHVKVFATPSRLQNLATGESVPKAKADDKGVGLMLAAAKRRYAFINELLPDILLEKLALASSGALRDYFRMIRSVCVAATASNASLPLSEERWLRLAEQSLRNEMPLADEDRAWLKKVRLTHGTGLEKISQLHQLARLFDSGVILNYRNGQDWCDVHYLLQDELNQ